MSIFTIQKDEKQDEIIRCAEYRKGAVESHLSAYLVAFNDFWNNLIVTPQEHCDAFGTSAAEFLDVSNATEQYLQSLIPDWVPPTKPYEFTINEDGTVTIGEKIEEPVVEEPTE